MHYLILLGPSNAIRVAKAGTQNRRILHTSVEGSEGFLIIEGATQNWKAGWDRNIEVKDTVGHSRLAARLLPF
jgi:hypothetical protein